MVQDCYKNFAVTALVVFVASFVSCMVLFFGYYSPMELIINSQDSCTATVVAVHDWPVKCPGYVVNPPTCYQHYAVFQWTANSSLVSNSSLQQDTVLLFTNQVAGQNIYLVGSSYPAYYDVCPLGPQTDFYVANCHQLQVPTSSTLLLQLPNSQPLAIAAIVTAIIALVSVCSIPIVGLTNCDSCQRTTANLEAGKISVINFTTEAKTASLLKTANLFKTADSISMLTTTSTNTTIAGRQ